MFEKLIKQLIFLKTYVLTEQNIQHAVEQGKTTLDIVQELMVATVQNGSKIGEILQETVELALSAKERIEQSSGRGIELDRDLQANRVTDLFEAFIRVELP